MMTRRNKEVVTLAASNSSERWSTRASSSVRALSRSDGSAPTIAKGTRAPPRRALRVHGGSAPPRGCPLAQTRMTSRIHHHLDITQHRTTRAGRQAEKRKTPGMRVTGVSLRLVPPAR